MQAHPLPFAGAERPRLVPDRVRDPEPAEVVHEPGPPQRANLRLGQPELGAGGRGEVGHRAGVPERVRGLEVDEVRDRRQRGVEPLAGQHHRERGLSLDHSVPRCDCVEAREDRLGVALSKSASAGIELLAAALSSELPSPPARRRRGTRPP